MGFTNCCNSLFPVDPDDDALGDLGGCEGRPAGGRGAEHLAGGDLAQVEVVGRSAVLVHVRASVPALEVGHPISLKDTWNKNLQLDEIRLLQLIYRVSTDQAMVV